MIDLLTKAKGIEDSFMLQHLINYFAMTFVVISYIDHK